MASGFLVADALAQALRRPYHRGNMDVTTLYLVEGLKIGSHRVMLKRNFDTACWIPPIGKRGSHSIYYGDRMVANVLHHFCEISSIELPTDEVLAEEVATQIKAKHDLLAAKLAKKGKPVPTMAKVNRTMVYDAKIAWLQDNLTKDMWDAFLDLVVKAVGAFGRHERSHARESPANLEQMNRDLRILGIPFMLWNWFEDARIEHISRVEMDMPFGWLDFEKLAPIGDPLALFQRCIQLEGVRDTEALDSEEPYGDGTRSMGHVADSIETYYQRACKCSRSEQLFPIMQEFLEEFKNDLPPPPSGKGKGKGSGSGSPEEGDGEGSGEGEEPDESDYWTAGEQAGDLSTAAEAAETGDKFFDEFEKDAEVVGGTDAEGAKAEAEAREKLKGPSPAPKGKGTSGAQGEAGSIEPTASGGRARPDAFLTEKAGQMDDVYAQRVAKLTAMLMRMFKSHNLPVAIEAPGRRMSGRHLARGELRFIHRKVFGGKGKRKYTIVYDCSGSMGGHPDREGKLLLLALNNLAMNGYLVGSLILSGYVDGQPGWLQYEFPVAEELILRINPSHGSEGLQDSLKDNLKHIKGTDDVFVYTDACICDAPIDRAFFAGHRVHPVGLYCGGEERASEMLKHFPQNIIRNTIEEVVETMLTRNRRTVG